MSRKVVLLLVEGATEETVLSEYLDERFEKHQVHLDVQRGDILAAWDKGKKTVNIKNKIGSIIKAYLTKSKIQSSDLLGVFQITDADGVFIPHEAIIVDSTLRIDQPFYREQSIIVKTLSKKSLIEQRNEFKSKNIKILSTMDTFKINKVDVPYRMYYFSTNIDHILWDERNAAKDQKVVETDQFIETLNISIEQFLWNYSVVSQEDMLESSYEKSWGKLTEGYSSLARITNVPLLFDFVEGFDSQQH